jgi:hypothetical protein
MQSTSKMPAIIGIILVVCAVGYYFYSQSNAPVSPDSSLTLTTTSSDGTSGIIGSNVLSLLSEIKGLNIDTSFFQTPVYESLTDFSVTIPAEPVGKSNPFTPLQGSILPVVSTTASSPSTVGH